ncbi:MAG: hypothetical protein AAF193_07035 [Bacteroidota bacterium]
MRGIGAFLVLFLLLLCLNTEAQCVMCKAVAEDASSTDNVVGAGINKAILYLMAVPYLLLGFLSVWFVRQRLKNKKTALS